MDKTLSPDDIRAKFVKILGDSTINDADYHKILSKYFNNHRADVEFLEDILEEATVCQLNRINNDYSEFPHKLLLTDEPARRPAIRCAKPPMSLKEISEFVTKMGRNPTTAYEVNALINGVGETGWVNSNELNNHAFNFELFDYRIVETE